jgi:hypothetical protein
MRLILATPKLKAAASPPVVPARLGRLFPLGRFNVAARVPLVVTRVASTPFLEPHSLPHFHSLYHSHRPSFPYTGLSRVFLLFSPNFRNTPCKPRPSYSCRLGQPRPEHPALPLTARVRNARCRIAASNRSYCALGITLNALSRVVLLCPTWAASTADCVSHFTQPCPSLC